MTPPDPPPPLQAERVRGVVFDLDGTLVDSFDAIAASVNRTRRVRSLAPLATSEVRRHVGRGLERLLRDLVGAEGIEESVRCFREHYAEVYLDSTRALGGALAGLGALHRRGLRLGVASNKPATFSRPILEHLGMLPFLLDVQGPDTAGRTKPDPAMLRLSLDRLGLHVSHSLYVGDMALDVESAARAGMPVVLVRSGSPDASDLLATGQLVLDDLIELVALLER